jgi:tol-pal system protein YbgF
LTAPSYDDSTNLEKLKADIVELKNKVHEQEAAINSLKRANSEWQKKSPDLNKTTTTSLKAPDSNKNGAISLKAPTLELSPASETIKSSPIPETEKERYQHASDLLKKANYSQAQQEFEALIKKYPTGSYADNAQYWIGVALLNRGDKKAAIQAFDHLARTYPKSDKIPDALFKLADTLISLKNKPKAKEYLDYVIQNYPGTNGAKLAAEKKRQEKL